MEKRKSRARAAAGASRGGGRGEERGTRRAELVLFCRTGGSLTSGQTDGRTSLAVRIVVFFVAASQLRFITFSQRSRG